MFSEDKDEDQGLILAIIAGIGALVIGGILALATWVGTAGSDAGEHKAAAAPATAVVAATAAAATAAKPAAADEARVVIENGVVKFYFATGKSDLAKGANEALAEVVKGVKAGHKAVISGYHDSTGNLTKNEELAKSRAQSVQKALVGLGVPANQIEMKKPENSQGTGDNAEARRVEVVLSK